MRSSLPKVLHPLCGRPLIAWPIQAARDAGAGKIVVVIEGPHSGVLGETLIGISGMDGVLAAHMVFEQALEIEETIDDDRTHAA